MRRSFKSGFFTPINPVGMLIVGAYMILWGFWVFLPWTAYNNNDALYHILQFIPEEIMGVVAASFGVFISIGSLRPVRGLTVACFLAFLYWLAVSVFLLLGNWERPTWLGSALTAALSMYFYLNLSLSKEENLTHNKR